MRKVFGALPPSWEVKSTTLKKINDKEEMELSGLIENLKTNEMERKARENVPQKKKTFPSNLLPLSPMKKKMTLKMMKIYPS